MKDIIDIEYVKQLEQALLDVLRYKHIDNIQEFASGSDMWYEKASKIYQLVTEEIPFRIKVRERFSDE